MPNQIPSPLVTVVCTVFNHGKYLKSCLDGFVMQKTDFPFIVLVHDDCSTDDSVRIIKEYADKYPNIIIPIIETENQYSKHDGSLMRAIDVHIKSKYVAYCEGGHRLRNFRYRWIIWNVILTAPYAFMM